MDDLGTIEMTEGVYVIVDGGYHKWKATISASRHGDGQDFNAWRKGLESVRKDIECGESSNAKRREGLRCVSVGCFQSLSESHTTKYYVRAKCTGYGTDPRGLVGAVLRLTWHWLPASAVFGILKGRFRLLKTPVLYHTKEDVDNIFFTCCALHNQLHQWDRRDEWENGMEWGTADGLFEEDTEPNYGTPMIRDVRERARPLRRAAADEDFSAVGTLHFGNATVALLGTPPVAAGAMDFNALVELHAENEGSGFAELQAKLVKNYAVKLKMGVRVWMRSGTLPGESSSSSS